MDVSPVEIVEEQITRLNTCMTARDLEGVLELFSPDGIFFGSEAGEYAEGEGLRTFFTEFFAQSFVVSWTLAPPSVRRVGDVVFFISTGTVELAEKESRQLFDYRLSGVLEVLDSGRVVFRLLDGSEPAVVEQSPFSSSPGPPGGR